MPVSSLPYTSVPSSIKFAVANSDYSVTRILIFSIFKSCCSSDLIPGAPNTPRLCYLASCRSSPINAYRAMFSKYSFQHRHGKSANREHLSIAGAPPSPPCEVQSLLICVLLNISTGNPRCFFEGFAGFFLGSGGGGRETLPTI